MRIVIFGLTVSSSWGNGHATIWRGLCRALGRNGHEVVFFEKDVPYYSSHRDLTNPPEYKLRLYQGWSDVEKASERALEESDCAIVTSYCPDARVAADIVLDSATFKIFYDLDTPVTLNRLKREGEVEYIPTYGLSPFDLVLSYTGGKALQELKRQLGAHRVAPLYGSVDPNVHSRVPAEFRFHSDFSYLGTYAEDRQSQLHELFLNPAKRLSDKKFCIAGAQYPSDFPWSSNIFFVRHLPPPEHPAFYSSSRLTLNITRQAMAAMGFCPSGRLFEAAACGTPIVSDYWEGLESFFTPGKEILIARSAQDAIAAIRLEEDELRRVALASQERALTEHSADRRAAELIALIEASA
ncbi:MAG TPA: glycosyltransferase [Candidatus Sulfotelmatobacter sp.]|nr:glycosyltransferase [Candidatus Sulfotelmatobacter sp.]